MNYKRKILISKIKNSVLNEIAKPIFSINKYSMIICYKFKKSAYKKKHKTTLRLNLLF